MVSLLPISLTWTVAGRGEGHISAVSAVAFSQRSASFLVSGGADKLLKVWDLAAALGAPAAPAASAKPPKKRKKGKAAEPDAAAAAIEPAADGQAGGACRSHSKLQPMLEGSSDIALTAWQSGRWTRASVNASLQTSICLQHVKFQRSCGSLCTACNGAMAHLALHDLSSRSCKY